MRSTVLVLCGAIVLLVACAAGEKPYLPRPLEADVEARGETILRDGLAIPRLPSPPAEGLRLPLRSRLAPLVQCTTITGESAMFELDTGSWRTFVTAREVDRLRLPIREIPEVDCVTLLGSCKFSRCARIDRLKLSDPWISPIDAVVFDFPFDIAGVLGVNVFGQVPVLFDVRRDEVLLLPEKYEDVLWGRYGDRDWNDLPLGWFGGFPYVTLTVRGVKLRMLFDTGSTSSCLVPRVAQSLKLQDLGADTFEEVDASGSHVAEHRGYHVEGMTFGDWILDFESWSTEGDLLGPEADGLLGFDVLRRIPFVFDARRDLVRILEPEMLLGRALRVDPNEETVAELRDPYPPFRKDALVGMASSEKLKYASLVAERLDDVDDSVVAEAARALSVFAKESWSEESQVERARRWWQAHRNDPEFARPATK
jgi:hypothetical protein